MPAPSNKAVKVAEQSYLNALQKAIVKHAQDTYPRRAKRRHWEGEVKISFTILPNGNIVNLKIVETSGKSILDQAALSIFQEKMQSRFKTFPETIKRETWDITVPVHYGLR